MDTDGVLVVDDYLTEPQPGLHGGKEEPLDTIRVLLVDNHAMVIDALASLIDGQVGIEVVGRAYDGQTALDLCERLRPDVVVLDYKMPGMNGPAVLSRLREKTSPIKVIFLSMYENVHYVIQAMEHGAQGYVKKSGVADELVTAVRAVFDGGRYVSSPLDDELANYGKVAPAERNGIEKLSPREFELLLHLGEGLTLQEAAAAMGVVESTASTYRARLMSKLGLTSTNQIIRFAIENGLVS